MQRVLLTTGGTGGHIFPALAVAEALREMAPGVRLLFVGGETGPEARLCARADIEFKALPARGVIGRGMRAVSGLLGLARAAWMARGVLREFRPQAVAGFGGYASVPAMAAASLAGVPSLLHEQNSIPGVSNRLLGRLARRVLTTFPDDAGAFPAAKTSLAGNPVRKDIAVLATLDRQPSGRKRLLVLGGSQGAVAINDAVLAALPRLLEAGVVIRHQTGEKDHARVVAGYRAAGVALTGETGVSAFIDDMAAAYAWADLALCRAGASTVAELACAGLPSILVPFPFATHDHQWVNAGHLEAAGAAVRIAQHEVAGPGTSRRDLAAEILALFDNPQRSRSMGTAARAWSRPQAAHAVAQALIELAEPAGPAQASSR